MVPRPDKTDRRSLLTRRAELAEARGLAHLTDVESPSEFGSIGYSTSLAHKNLSIALTLRLLAEQVAA